MKKNKTEGAKVPAFSFQAEVIKVTTMESGALRVILDMPEHLVNIAAVLIECKRQGIPLILEAKADTV